MAQLLWSLICSRVLIDNQSNLVSYIDAIEQFQVQSFPTPFPPLFLALLWRRDVENETLRLRVRLIGPDKKVVVKYEPDPPLKMERIRHRLHVNLAGVEVKGPGRYLFVVDLLKSNKWSIQGMVPVEIALAEQTESRTKRPKKMRPVK